MPKKYDAVIFDLGGVLYDIDIQRTVDAFKAIGINQFEKIYTLKAQTELIDALEKGWITEQGFYKSINTFHNSNLSDKQIKDAWNALLIGMAQDSVSILKNLKAAGYKLYLLSNTNVLHYNAIQEEIQRDYQLGALSDLFDQAFYSFDMGMRKPDSEIYHKVIADINMPGANLIFIDDNLDNVNSAISSGLLSVQKEKEVTLAALLEKHGIV